MENKLNIVNANIDNDIKNSIDNEIDKYIDRFRDSGQHINRLVFDSIALLTEADDKESELTNKGTFKRLIGSVTGTNKKLEDAIRKNRGQAQYLAQQMIQRLAEEQLLTFDLIAKLNNQLSFKINIVNKSVEEINNRLAKFLYMYNDEQVKIYSRLDDHERSIKALQWLSTLAYKTFNGSEYRKLDDIAKIVCIAKDFYDITKGRWTETDLLMIKSALHTLNIDSDKKINYLDTLCEIYDSYELYNRYITYDLNLLEADRTRSLLIMEVFHKFETLDSNEAYLIDTYKQISNKSLDNNSLKKVIIKSFVYSNLQVDIDNNISCYNFVLDLLYNLKYSNPIIESDESEINTIDVDVTTAPMVIDEDEELIKQEQLDYAEELYDQALEALKNNDIDSAYLAFEECLELGYFRAAYDYANSLIYDEPSDETYLKALEILDVGIENGNNNCCYLLAKMCENNLGGLELDIDLIKSLYNKVIDLGSNNYIIGMAQNDLADILFFESELGDDYTDILDLYVNAFDNGYFKAITNLGLKYQEGDKLFKDDALAMHYFIMGAEKWEPGAMYWLAKGIWDGKYLKNQSRQERYNRINVFMNYAADAGNEDAIKFFENLGLM